MVFRVRPCVLGYGSAHAGSVCIMCKEVWTEGKQKIQKIVSASNHQSAWMWAAQGARAQFF